MMVKAHVSPGFRAKIKPQTEQRSRWDHPENSGPSPQCGQRLRSPRRSAVPINFERDGLMLELRILLGPNHPSDLRSAHRRKGKSVRSPISGSQIQTRHRHLNQSGTLRSGGAVQGRFSSPRAGVSIAQPASPNALMRTKAILTLAAVTRRFRWPRGTSARAARARSRRAAPAIMRRGAAEIPSRRVGAPTSPPCRPSGPAIAFWQHVFTMPDGSIAFGSAVDGRLLATFPAKGSGRARPCGPIPRSPASSTVSRSRANWVNGENRWRSSWSAPPDRCCTTRRAETRCCMNARRYGAFLAEWGAIYERFGVPADIGLAQVIFESGLKPTRRSEANAVGFCQWLAEELETTELLLADPNRGAEPDDAGALLRRVPVVLATKYGSFIPALSEHNAGGTNVGRALINGEHLGAEEVRARYFLRLPARPRPAGVAGQGLRGRPQELWPALVSLRGDGVRQHVQHQKTDRVDAPDVDQRDAHAAPDFARRDRRADASLCGRGAPVQSGTRRTRARSAPRSTFRSTSASLVRRRVLAPAASPSYTAVLE